MYEVQKESYSLCCYWLAVLHKLMRIQIYCEVIEAHNHIQDK